MTTARERRDFRAAMERDRIWSPAQLLAAAIETMPAPEAMGWLRALRWVVDEEIELRERDERERQPANVPIFCDSCGQVFYALPQARYCSNACRQRAYRRRSALSAP